MPDVIATTDIVSLEELKEHLRVDGAYDNTSLTRMLDAAREHLEAWVGALDDFEDPIPEDIGMALKTLVGHWFDTARETTSSELLHDVPFGFHDLISPYRKWEF